MAVAARSSRLPHDNKMTLPRDPHDELGGLGITSSTSSSTPSRSRTLSESAIDSSCPSMTFSSSSSAETTTETETENETPPPSPPASAQSTPRMKFTFDLDAGAGAEDDDDSNAPTPKTYRKPAAQPSSSCAPRHGRLALAVDESESEVDEECDGYEAEGEGGVKVGKRGSPVQVIGSPREQHAFPSASGARKTNDRVRAVRQQQQQLAGERQEPSSTSGVPHILPVPTPNGGAIPMAAPPRKAMLRYRIRKPSGLSIAIPAGADDSGAPDTGELTTPVTSRRDARRRVEKGRHAKRDVPEEAGAKGQSLPSSRADNGPLAGIQTPRILAFICDDDGEISPIDALPSPILSQENIAWTMVAKSCNSQCKSECSAKRF